MVAFALIWALILRYVIASAATWLADGSGGRLIGSIFNSRLIDSLLNWQVAEFSAFWVIALYLFPMLCLTLAADQTASDRARGTLRLLSLHTTRGSIFFGRFVGLMMVQALLLVLAILATFALAIMRDPTLFAVAMQTAIMVFVNLILLIAAYTAAMALISLFAESARQATTYAIILWIAIGLGIYWLTKYIPEASLLKWVLPGSHIKALLHHNNWQSMQLALVPLLQTAALLLIGYLVMKRRDV